jgi:hypothetical protein
MDRPLNYIFSNQLKENFGFFVGKVFWEIQKWTKKMSNFGKPKYFMANMSFYCIIEI